MNEKIDDYNIWPSLGCQQVFYEKPAKETIKLPKSYAKYLEICEKSSHSSLENTCETQLPITTIEKPEDHIGKLMETCNIKDNKVFNRLPRKTVYSEEYEWNKKIKVNDDEELYVDKDFFKLVEPPNPLTALLDELFGPENSEENTKILCDVPLESTLTECSKLDNTNDTKLILSQSVVSASKKSIKKCTTKKEKCKAVKTETTKKKTKFRKLEIDYTTESLNHVKYSPV